jgi:hypothetical protein
MDDYSVSSLTESQNEWCARLVHILTPLIIGGFKSIFSEAVKLCNENNENDKYLMTFQTFIGQVPKWNTATIQAEKQRIIEKSNCSYLEELITCVHIIKLKALTCVRVGQKQKKIDINVPSLDDFIHKTYINVARKIYTNVYLFENLGPDKSLQIQKNNRELEMIIRECILLTIRDSIPVENILRAYMDETQETDVEIDEHVEVVEKEAEGDELDIDTGDVVSNNDDNVPQIGGDRIKFNDIDSARTHDGDNEEIHAPKTIERLEEISQMNAERRRLEEEEDEDDKLKIGPDVSFDVLDIHDVSHQFKVNSSAPIIDIDPLPL